ncbi:fumarylacetoacetate hydrolase family protein [Aliiruegeria lutimaris]|uniref:2-keto-4-pentenoate hydratase/2-oxohepta-3-ene-1,7-dioic acid hydratase (Catechol pathway) n=1 Tax=Aliiruegeria lutimaris TaxID=571298 RepID=A0A1G9HMF4_9RHOB|nr:fumarylacetoacetate hydrolase family protein [Aliiruegeria lutimaris]SDL13693.1 2-keto-4-pentenoate hydratase/2-oxohepta-3-ene-1,7-dioic acid hydratase (catechol pathway) [Aliiruegeria lutimaris]
MKLATLLEDAERKLGVVDGDTIVDLAAAGLDPEITDMTRLIAGGDPIMEDVRQAVAIAPDHARHPICDIALAAPMLPSTVLCAGSNYRSHNAEKAGAPLSGKEPEFFIKTSDCVIGPNDPIVHDTILTKKLDCETELAIVIGKPGRHIPTDRALKHVFGYTVANDVTARDRQVRFTETGTVFYELGRGKAFDSSLPLGPVITTADEIPDPQALALSTRINGELRQHANTSEMIWSCAELIHVFSMNFTLRPGMIILTGTPSGTAWSVDAELGGSWHPTEDLLAASRYCLRGDVVENEIEAIGCLRNPVV